jgi:Cu-Zn family superoxide dismutase
LVGMGMAGAAEPVHDHGASPMDHNHGGSSAAAELVALSGSHVSGTLRFIQHDNSNVLIQGAVTGLTPGKHGFHIHVNGNCDSPDGMSAGGHYGPSGGRHGALSSKDHHLGDLGNIEADRSGVANVNVNVQGVSLALIGLNSIVDRAVVIHANEDDFSDPAGNSGARVACGVIEQAIDMRM